MTTQDCTACDVLAMRHRARSRTRCRGAGKHTRDDARRASAWARRPMRPVAADRLDIVDQVLPSIEAVRMCGLALGGVVLDPVAQQAKPPIDRAGYLQPCVQMPARRFSQGTDSGWTRGGGWPRPGMRWNNASSRGTDAASGSACRRRCERRPCRTTCPGVASRATAANMRRCCIAVCATPVTPACRPWWR